MMENFWSQPKLSIFNSAHSKKPDLPWKENSTSAQVKVGICKTDLKETETVTLF